jgi:hypothetical protein
VGVKAAANAKVGRPAIRGARAIHAAKSRNETVDHAPLILNRNDGVALALIAFRRLSVHAEA